MIRRLLNIEFLEKKIWEWFLYHILRTIFQEKYFYCYSILNDEVSSCDFPYFLRFWATIALQSSSPVFDVKNFEVSLISVIMSFLYMTKKSRQKYEIWISWEQKELLRWNEKHFPSFLKGFQLKKCKKSSQSWVCVLKNSFYNVAPLKKIQNFLCLTFSFGCV